jgi:large subunit ribosomal protein L6
MSKIGKKPLALPKGVELKLQDAMVSVKGPKGELKTRVRPEVSIEIKEGAVWVKRQNESRLAHALHGTYRSLLKNMIVGVTDGYEKKLELVGVGYKAEVKGKTLVLSLGFSKPVEFPLPEAVQASVDKNIISIRGIDKQAVGEVASEIRALRPPEPYQGKGIRYVGEYVRHKAGKAAVAGGAPGAATK